MSDFKSLFFMECIYFHIESNLKTFQNIVYALIYAQQLLIIYSLARIGAHMYMPHAPPCWGEWAKEV